MKICAELVKPQILFFSLRRVFPINGRPVLRNTLKNLDHALNAWRAYFFQEVILLEVLLAFFCCQLTSLQQFTANKRAMFLGKLVHEFPCFQVGQFHG